MAPTVNSIVDDILTREGGYVNDADDPGGPTKFGVTLATLRRLGMDVTGDGSVDTDDVKALSRRDAADTILRHYYQRPRLNALPEIVQPSVFDMQVNAGAQAVRLLQQVLGEMGEPLIVDGIVGRKTAAAAARMAEKAPEVLVNAYGIARRNYYYALADRRPASRKYARRRDGGKGGWITRAEEFIAPEYRLSDAAHRERTAKWV
ncbi:MAG: peptidoglycan-binding protein [Rhodobacteraceae bacterium]|nr:peptidoglycan-binding protein [Paracoccaceae bacterium]